jgi:lambda repressor-like predicted transcriptional regulator
VTIFRLDTEKIKGMIESKGWSVAEFGRRIGVKSRQHAHYIIKKGGPDYATKIAKALDIDPMELLVSNVHAPDGFGIVRGKLRRTRQEN